MLPDGLAPVREKALDLVHQAFGEASRRDDEANAERTSHGGPERSALERLDQRNIARQRLELLAPPLHA